MVSWGILFFSFMHKYCHGDMWNVVGLYIWAGTCFHLLFFSYLCYSKSGYQCRSSQVSVMQHTIHNKHISFVAACNSVVWNNVSLIGGKKNRLGVVGEVTDARHRSHTGTTLTLRTSVSLTPGCPPRHASPSRTPSTYRPVLSSAVQDSSSFAPLVSATTTTKKKVTSTFLP